MQYMHTVILQPVATQLYLVAGYLASQQISCFKELSCIHILFSAQIQRGNNSFTLIHLALSPQLEELTNNFASYSQACTRKEHRRCQPVYIGFTHAPKAMEIMHPISQVYSKIISTLFVHACMPSYVAIAHVVDLEILKQVSVHIIKLCGWAYNAVTKSHASF